MARVVVVHGINNTYSGPRSMAAEWVPALLDGIYLAGHGGSLAADDIGCVFYGDLFRKPAGCWATRTWPFSARRMSPTPLTWKC